MSSDIVIALDLVLVVAVVLLIIVAIRDSHSDHETGSLRRNKKRRDPEWLQEPEGPGPEPPSYEYVLRFGESSSHHN